MCFRALVCAAESGTLNGYGERDCVLDEISGEVGILQESIANLARLTSTSVQDAKCEYRTDTCQPGFVTKEVTRTYNGSAITIGIVGIGGRKDKVPRIDVERLTIDDENNRNSIVARDGETAIPIGL